MNAINSRTVFLTAVIVFTLAPVQLLAADGSITVIDVPGAAGTVCTGINNAGQITGYYSNKANMQYGFLRDVNGKFTFFSETGANSTSPVGINDSGTVAGTVYDLTAFHGFIREASGQVTKFGPGGKKSTFSEAINNAGEIVGQTGAFKVVTSFIRDSSGNLALFSLPGSNCGSGDDAAGVTGCTYAMAINNLGQAAGIWYRINVQQGPYGFIRNADGVLAAFSAPNADATEGTNVTGIDDQGLVTGYFGDQATVLRHGFTRDASGNFAIFNVTDPTTNQPDATFPYAISRNGQITGVYTDALGAMHGFIRDHSGNITTFDAPGAGSGEEFGTAPVSINNSGAVTGYFTDVHGVGHGFVRN